MIEEFCSFMGGRDDLWYATNMEIVDYIHALRNLRLGEGSVFDACIFEKIISNLDFDA